MLERLLREYPGEQQRFVRAAGKAEVLAYLKGLAAAVERMEDFDRFPEGAMGAIIYALLEGRVSTCPDVDDFGDELRAIDRVARASFRALSDRFPF